VRHYVAEIAFSRNPSVSIACALFKAFSFADAPESIGRGGLFFLDPRVVKTQITEAGLDRYPRCLLGNACCTNYSHAARRSVFFCTASAFTPMAQIKPNSSRPIAVTTFPFSLPRAINFR
jgi:hypothetical protein